MDVVQDGLLSFRHLLEKHDLAVAIFAEVNAVLSEKGLSMKRGTVVDATLIVTLFALANLWLARKRLLPLLGEVRP